MRLGRKLSEGFAVDRDADTGVPAPAGHGTERTVPVSAEADSAAGVTGTAAQPVGSGQPPTG